jgi:outer membrane protein assembly factor BamB
MRRSLKILGPCLSLFACSNSTQTQSPDTGQPDAVVAQSDASSNDPAPLGPDISADNLLRDIIAGQEPAAISDATKDQPGAPGTDGARGADAESDGVLAARQDGARDTLPMGLADGGHDLAGEVASAGGTTGHVSVLEHHSHPSRDGFYVDPALSHSAVAALHVDPAFAAATIAGPTYTQPLYLAGAAGHPDLVIVATEQNHVYAFDASVGGKPVWDQTLGMPLPKSRLATLRPGCGNIDPLGVTGTPIIDPATRTVYLDAMLIASANATAQHQVFALDADTGQVRSGWPVDLNSKVTFGSTTFNSLAQNQRGALALLGGKVFVPFGGHIGDCSDYHGWIVGISTQDPTQVSAWASRAIAGGVWAPGGISTDGESLYFATGNTENQANTFSAPPDWQDGETIFRLPPSLAFSGKSADYFTPSNWAALDAADSDIGGSGPIIFDLPGATPSGLVIGLGKDGNAYLVDRSNLGGISSPLVLASVATGTIINAAAAYTTPNGSYVVFKGTGKNCPAGQSGGLAAFKIAPASPPTVAMAWCGGPSTQDSPAASATDSQGTDALVWIVGTDNKLYALDGDTGKAVFSGGAAADAMSSVQKFVTPIIANGRVFVAANNQVYAFTP